MKRWEAVCKQCGLCCHDKVQVAPRCWVLLDSKCQFLGDDGRCTVYAERFKRCQACRKMTVWRAMSAAWIPPGCAYLEWARRHHLRLRRKQEWSLLDACDDSG